MSKSFVHLAKKYLLLKPYKFTFLQKLWKIDCHDNVVLKLGFMKQYAVIRLINCYPLVQLRHGFASVAT